MAIFHKNQNAFTHAISMFCVTFCNLDNFILPTVLKPLDKICHKPNNGPLVIQFGSFNCRRHIIFKPIAR